MCAPTASPYFGAKQLSAANPMAGRAAVEAKGQSAAAIKRDEEDDGKERRPLGRGDVGRLRAVRAACVLGMGLWSYLPMGSAHMPTGTVWHCANAMCACHSRSAVAEGCTPRVRLQAAWVQVGRCMPRVFALCAAAAAACAGSTPLRARFAVTFSRA